MAKQTTKRQRVGKRINPDRKFLFLQGAEDLLVAIISKRTMTFDDKQGPRNVYEAVVLQESRNGVDATGKGGQQFETGDIVFIGENSGLEVLDPYVQKPAALLICPIEKVTTKKGRAFWRFEVYEQELTIEDKAILSPHFHAEI